MRNLALFGCGQIAEIEIKNGAAPICIFDNNPDLVGTSFFGYQVQPISSSNLSKIDEILICSSSISDIYEQIIDLGFDHSKVRISQQLGELAKAFDLENYRFTGFISSGLPSRSQSLGGGGIFCVEEQGDSSVTIKKIFEGNTHGCIRDGDNLIFSAQGVGIIVMDVSSKEVINVVPIEQGLRPHGVRRVDDQFFVACSLDDSIRVYQDNGTLVERYALSDKVSRQGTPQHHCNDIFVTDHSIYVSMFSLSGNWKLGVFDGGILEIDRSSGNKQVVKSGLTMPHNVTVVDRKIFVLDSFNGAILGHNFELVGTLTGFTRGLDFDQNIIIVGESKNRNATRMNRGQSIASLDSRITLIDPETKICRSIHLPKAISEIHAIISG